MKNKISRNAFPQFLRMRHMLSVILLVGILQVVNNVNVVSQETKRQAPDKGQVEWPCYLGSNGNFSEGSHVPLIDDISQIRLLWESEEKAIGFGKTSIGDFPHVDAKFGKLPPGGVASPIVAATEYSMPLIINIAFSILVGVTVILLWSYFA